MNSLGPTRMGKNAKPHLRAGTKHQTPLRAANRRDQIDSKVVPIENKNENDGSDADVDAESSEQSFSQRHLPLEKTRQPARTIDWRTELCQVFKLDPESKDSALLDFLDSVAERLEEAEQLKAIAFETRDTTPVYHIIHRITCAAENSTSLYKGEPFVVNSGPRDAHIRGSDEIHNYELYLEKNKNLSFLGFKDYQCCDSVRAKRHHVEKLFDINPDAFLLKEFVCIISTEFSSAMKVLADVALSEIACPDFDIGAEFASPYLWWFHGRAEIAEHIDYLEECHRKHIELFQKYINNRLQETWLKVDALLNQGKISAHYIQYLFVPNALLISQAETENFRQHQGYLSGSWLTWQYTESSRDENGRVRQIEFHGGIEASSWTFDGNFEKKKTRLIIDRLPSSLQPFDIRHLMLYPVKYATIGVQAILRARGEMFWKCRFRNYVCAIGDQSSRIQSNSDPRYMIDIATYKQMHETEAKKDNQPENQDDLGPDIMAIDEPPGGDEFLLCLPRTIPGYDMNKKEWVNLDVSRLAPVRWNTEAFKSLVVDKETKELISALVTNQIDAEKSTDLMSGKGNGLFILLHGGPGTGKTLTAESVAEYSEKPLYRVTCGDVGTKAEDVEEYLETVMYLGKTWGCVVLLDEADVFLEQRRIFDLQRNALVSVFLRVLEYYEGILILTSNRVGIFDEAFKSRIQLTLRYKNLETAQRKQIWINFISRLEGFQNSVEISSIQSTSTIHGGIDFGINASEVRGKLDELARAELNGREIRNAVSTARQLAMFRKEPMGYEHLRVVINEAKKFDTYLLELNNGLTRDEIMESKHERLTRDI